MKNAPIKSCAAGTPDHRGKIAEKSIVLLKNDGLLPIRKDLRSVAVIGPAADTVLMATIPKHAAVKAGFLCWTESVLQSAPRLEVLYERGCNFLGQALHPLVRPCCTMKTAKPG